MALTFGALLYFQVIYLENMVKMREQQFSESVMRSLYATSQYLERRETLHFLEQDANLLESSIFDTEEEEILGDNGSYNRPKKLKYEEKSPKNVALSFPSATQSIDTRYKAIQDVIRSQYLYQQGLLNEVILSILRESDSRPAIERADSVTIINYLTNELASNGLNVPFAICVTNEKGLPLYQSQSFDESAIHNIYSQILFPNSNVHYYLKISFPTKGSYIFSSVRFIIPTLSFTLILLVVFLYTIILAFRQKKLTEMKNDFINNMTHELKTPISTISLAAQMLKDPAVKKAPAMLEHLSSVIGDESKRLRFQVEKVLQMSLFTNSQSTFKFTEIDADDIINNVVHTFQIKVEKYGGSIEMNLDADDPLVYVDEMHFTNVIFNLLDNAVKYRREDVPLHLVVSTSNPAPGKYQISVSDNGIGIKKDDLKKIFERFYRVPTGNRHDVKGFGLGLAYVNKMIGVFEGKIKVESEFGKGTTFIIVLPTSEGVIPQEAVEPQENDNEEINNN